MLDRIWHLRGSIPLSVNSSDAVVFDRLAKALSKQQKSIASRDHSSLDFDGPLITFGGNWHTLVIYDRGRFEIERGPNHAVLRYDLRSLHAFFFCLGAGALFAGIALPEGWAAGLRMGLLAIGWLYGMNLILAVLRVPGWLQRAIAP